GGPDAGRTDPLRGPELHRRRRADAGAGHDGLRRGRVPGGARAWTVRAVAGGMRITGGTVLSMRPGDEPSVRDVAIEGDRIVASADGERIDASGCYVMPGLVQTHIHLEQRIFRGLAEQRSLLEWLRDRIWPLEAAHDDRSLRARAQLGLPDLLTPGT